MIEAKAEVSRDLEKVLQELEQVSLPLWGNSHHKRRSVVSLRLLTWIPGRLEVICLIVASCNKWELGAVWFDKIPISRYYI